LIGSSENCKLPRPTIRSGDQPRRTDEPNPAAEAASRQGERIWRPLL
jgi:hypothetical protein